MAVEFSYSDVEGALAKLNRVATDKRIAFRARLKHLQRQGFPAGVNTGTGRRAAYSVASLLQLALATELTQAGMAPKRVVRIIEGNWWQIARAFLVAMSPVDYLNTWEVPPETNKLSLVLNPEALRDLSEEGEGEFDYYESIAVITADGLGLALGSHRENPPSVGETWRNLIINIHDLSSVLIGLVRDVRPDLSRSDIILSFEDYIREKQREFQEAAASIEKVFGR
ncbi:hypothetical protein [Sphingomonas phyllosphaerae]|uniref:hypothetical protein n=1 Tax=Sphingomonas phyllosphaerae TaxID=257003 RepID=UPI0003B7AB94|nr:hypothetical protein [Sphingomonas phyllosphaerae]